VAKVPLSPAALYLGVDAGNSKTLALVCDAGGRVVGSGRSGNGDIYGATSEQAAVDAVVSAVNQALTSAGTGVESVCTAAFRLAGIDWPEDHAYWLDALDHSLPSLGELARRGRCSISNDGFAAIRCGEPSGVGVAVVSGTGAAVAGRGPGGDEWSMSFWIQDEAHGAGALVGQALRAVYRAELGLGPQTELTKRLLDFFEYADAERMLHESTRRHQTTPARPGHTAAREVFKAAVDGDEVAQAILRTQGEHLAGYARITAQRVGFQVDADEVPVVLAGSLLSAEESPMAAALQAALLRRFPGGRARLATLPPVAGATLDALAEAGVAITDGLVETLRATAPPPAFVQT
jgi:N-acetylglucosamine kinase-like BadF-type ATPase